tara:strand:+ start:452 stop:700 length:249 start_codon:yes stop_codon:yes gene_type:complete
MTVWIPFTHTCAAKRMLGVMRFIVSPGSDVATQTLGAAHMAGDEPCSTLLVAAADEDAEAVEAIASSSSICGVVVGAPASSA